MSDEDCRKNKKSEKYKKKSNKKEFHELTKVEKIDHFLIYFYQITIEMSLVDLIFSATFNIEGDYSSGDSYFYLGKIAS